MMSRYAIAIATSLVGLVWTAAAQETEVSRRQIGELVLEGVPEIAADARERMLPYLNARGAAVRDITEDGSQILITTRFGDTYQLHVVSQPMGARTQITFSDEPISSGFFMPGTDGSKVIYSCDVGGNEVNRYFLFDRETARATPLTPDVGRTGSMCCSQDGTLLVYSSTARDGQAYDVYAVDLAGDRTPRLVWQTDGAFYPVDISRDKRRVIVQQYISASHARLYALDLESGQNACITPDDPPRYYGGGAWAPDGNSVYIVSDRDGEFRKLYRLDFRYGEWANLTADIDWDVADFNVEPNGAGIAFVTNEDGMSKLYFAGPSGENRKRIDDLPIGLTGAPLFNREGGYVAITINTARTPSDAFRLTFPEGRIERWTKSEVGGMDTDRFVEPKFIRYPTFDEVDGAPRLIPAFYYAAPQPGPRPVVIYAHGGPESKFRPGFASTFQQWALELGVSVIAPNIRGSTGYGRAYHMLDNAEKREDAIKDIGALLDWIAQQPELDAQRVGITGGSYGGYVVLASMTTYPERIKAGICKYGIANFLTFLENTGDYRRDLRRVEYGDERDEKMRAMLERISPLNSADKIEGALLIVHGKNDPRVPYTEAEQIVTKMRELHRPVWYLLALDEGHGYAKKENADLNRLVDTMFWEEQLLK